MDFQENQLLILLKKYPDRKPVVIKPSKKSRLPELKKDKYLLPNEMQIGNVILIIRKEISLKPQEALFLLINNKLLSNTTTISEAFEGGLIKIEYTIENTFG